MSFSIWPVFLLSMFFELSCHYMANSIFMLEMIKKHFGFIQRFQDIFLLFIYGGMKKTISQLWATSFGIGHGHNKIIYCSPREKKLPIFFHSYAEIIYEKRKILGKKRHYLFQPAELLWANEIIDKYCNNKGQLLQWLQLLLVFDCNFNPPESRLIDLLKDPNINVPCT